MGTRFCLLAAMHDNLCVGSGIWSSSTRRTTLKPQSPSNYPRSCLMWDPPHPLQALICRRALFAKRLQNQTENALLQTLAFSCSFVSVCVSWFGGIGLGKGWRGPGRKGEGGGRVHFPKLHETNLAIRRVHDTPDDSDFDPDSERANKPQCSKDGVYTYAHILEMGPCKYNNPFWDAISIRIWWWAVNFLRCHLYQNVVSSLLLHQVTEARWLWSYQSHDATSHHRPCNEEHVIWLDARPSQRALMVLLWKVNIDNVSLNLYHGHSSLYPEVCAHVLRHICSKGNLLTKRHQLLPFPCTYTLLSQTLLHETSCEASSLWACDKKEIPWPYPNQGFRFWQFTKRLPSTAVLREMLREWLRMNVVNGLCLQSSHLSEICTHSERHPKNTIHWGRVLIEAPCQRLRSDSSLSDVAPGVAAHPPRLQCCSSCPPMNNIKKNPASWSRCKGSIRSCRPWTIGHRQEGGAYTIEFPCKLHKVACSSRTSKHKQINHL